MARLIVFRHGKTEIVSKTGKDFDRELIPKGERNAAQMGGMIKTHASIPDIAIVSPARRARQTAELALAAMAFQSDPIIDDRIYNATGDTLCEVLHDHASAHETVLIIGHNPGLIMLMDIMIAPEQDLKIADFPTAAVGDLVFEAKTFSTVAPNSGKLISLMRPRDFGFNI